MTHRLMGQSIVTPTRPKRAPLPGSMAVMVATVGDMRNLCQTMNIPPEPFDRLFLSRFLLQNDVHQGVSIVGPLVGAPYATMILETLVACGVHKILFFGWCGAVSPKVSIGEIILPNKALIDEGTSPHYLPRENSGKNQACDGYAKPSDTVIHCIRRGLKEQKLKFHEGAVWTTDAIFRETPEKVKYYQKREILAVEMELSALFTAGKFHGVEVGGILVVSDSISGYTWRQGFKDSGFKTSRKAVSEVIRQLCQAG
jgi:uridine phosphorylase